MYTTEVIDGVRELSQYSSDCTMNMCILVGWFLLTCYPRVETDVLILRITAGWSENKLVE